MPVEMSRAQDSGFTIKSIITEIVQQCAERGQLVSDALAAFMVKSMALDPRNGFNVNRTPTREEVLKLVELCLDRLMEKCNPSLDTIKLQVYFDLNYTPRCEFLEEIHQVAESRLSTVNREITDSRVKTQGELDALYSKIITYIVLHSGMGSAADVNTVQEATAALQSVFPQTELGTFMVLLKRDKEQQLNELAMIVTGIQLVNKAIKIGEEEIDLHELMPVALNKRLPIVSQTIEEELSVSQRLAWKFTAVLEKLTLPGLPEKLQGNCNIPTVLLKQALYNVRQHEVFLKMLLDDAHECTQHVESLQRELTAQIMLLKETLKLRTAVPTANVFPLFKTLSKLWSGLQDEAELLHILSRIRLNLQPFIAAQAKIFSEDYLDGLVEESEVKTDEQRMTESEGEQIVPVEMKTQEWLLPKTTANFNNLLLQYNGVCGYTVVSRDGLLLPGNPHIGVLKHKEKLYVFSSKKAALTFASCPDDFIAQVAEKAKLYPELIHLLQLHQEFSCISPFSERQPGDRLLGKPITKCDSSIQTDMHPLATNNVKSYEWNEWELRRKAIKLTDLLTKVTHSVQTDLCHMRRESITQTWPTKDAACQSKRDNERNVPKPQTYLAGLRGKKDRSRVKTSLPRSVDE
ncbi:cilia- and flagella-associated protein 206 [Echeneis naucrates]|uniref:Cilia- and flagella-associated protein 206 n=1 Tax=Echeneis naucrates TaxID=173247 RepID=A0A665WPF1_ECHNA|nr:cilia- and flagella-associated protein 206 [Echeneis naucrates]